MTTDSDVALAIKFLIDVGVEIVAAPRKWQTRGFDYHAPRVGQMLSRSDVVTFAQNERELRNA